ncbi:MULTISPECIES: ribose-phosphate diphosphokinase [Gemella]|uniref:ribose-phosphate diphosphokinase n=1 Tax=Gemella TaxID=1378 RepID=UPI0007683153|nr:MULTISPECIES: ribose-phosphate diphosphokinase [Gemella]AME09250.1 ribose-phosphate pyrophosphokinase [Gemella sp. oral taxon 928]AXI26883.1 ribose-phosphate pyrophosphokinase [Gemella sp. ND 6198]
MLVDKPLKLFSLNSNIPLAKQVANSLGVELSKCSVKKFSDGEVSINIEESVRGCEVFVIQSTSEPVNDNLMTLLIMIDALKRASVDTINVVIPYYGYARQDRKARSREPITAKLVANLLEVAGADRVIALDLHALQIQGFFDIPVDHLMAVPIIAKYFKNKLTDMDDVVVVSPDHGGVTRARKLADSLNTPIAIIDKRRPKPNVAEVMNIVGNIEGKTCILIDDIIDTAGTITLGAKALKNMGAKEVYASCSHAVLSGQALERIEDSPIKELVYANTIHIPEEKKLDKMVPLCVGELIAKAIYRIHHNEPVSVLFD